MQGENIGIGQRLYRLKAHHVAFWLAYYLFWAILFRDYYSSLGFELFVISIYFVFNAVPFYVINYYLLPKFLPARKVLVFFGLTLAVVLVCSLGLSLSLFSVFGDIKGWQMMYAYITGFTSVGLCVGTLSAAKFFVEKIRSDRSSRAFEHQRLKAELQYLKAQVNPHFLFNAINSVYVLIRKDPEKAAETLIKLSDLLRFQLYDCADEKISIENEMAYIGNFISLEKLRRGERITVNFETAGDLSGFQIAPFLSIPFLENAFKFVSHHADKPNEVSISMKRENTIFETRFYNTKDECPPSGVGGIGLKNVTRRLELLYPNKHKISIEDRSDSYLTVLTLNLE